MGKVMQNKGLCGKKHIYLDPIPRWGDVCVCGKKKLELFRVEAPELDYMFTQVGGIKSYKTVLKEIEQLQEKLKELEKL